MTMEKRLPMASNMEKMATEETVKDDVVCVDGDDWSLTLSKEVYDKAGENMVKAIIGFAMETLKSKIITEGLEIGRAHV